MANQHTNPAKKRLREWLEAFPTCWLHYSPVAIAGQCGISRSSVYNWLYDLLAEIHGLTPDSFRRIRQLQSTVTPETRGDIIQFLKKGADLRETAHHFGLHEWNVRAAESYARDIDFVFDRMFGLR